MSSIRPGNLLTISNPDGLDVMLYDGSAVSESSDPWMTLVKLAEGRPEAFKHIPAGDPFLCIEVIWDQSDINLNICISILWGERMYLMFCNVLEVVSIV